DLVIAAATRLPHERGNRVAHAGALAHPRVDLLQVETQLRGLLARIVEADRVEVLTTARLGAVGDHHAVARLLLPANAPESDRYVQVCLHAVCNAASASRQNMPGMRGIPRIPPIILPIPIPFNCFISFCICLN